MAGTLVFGLGADTAQVVVTATDTSTSLRANITTALESLAGVGAGNVAVTGSRADGFILTFINDLLGTDVTSLTVSAESPVVATAVIERIAGKPAQDNVTLTPVNVNTRLLLETDIDAGTLVFTLRGESRSVVVSPGTSDAALLSQINTALSGFSAVGTGNVSVSGGRASGFSIEFINDLAGQDVSDLVLSVQTPGVEASVSTLVQGKQVVTSTATTGAYNRERQTISFTDGFRSTNTRYQLEFNGLTTGLLDFSVNSPTYNRAILQSALESLTTIKKGNVLVAFDQGSTSAAPRYFVDFTGKLAYQNVPEISVVSANNVTVTVSTSRDGQSATSIDTVENVSAEQQVRVQSAAAGTFTLSLLNGGTIYTTGPLVFEATAAQVQSALNTALSPIVGASVTVTSSSTGVWKVVFGGSLAGKEIARMTVATTLAPLNASLRITERGMIRLDTTTVTSPAIDEVQRVRVSAETGGSFTLSLDYDGSVRITGDIGFDAAASEVESALDAAFTAVAGAQFEVTRITSGVWDVRFGGTLGGADLGMLEGVASPDVAAASLVVEVLGESIAQPDIIPNADPYLVVDFGVQNLEVMTGPSSTMTLDMDGLDGALIRASGNLNIDLFGFFMIDGGFGFEKSSETVLLADGTEVVTDKLAVGGGGLNAFAGVNGGSDHALGLSLEEVDFALVLFSSRADATRKWTALQATVNRIALVGIDGLTASSTAIDVRINHAGAGEQVIDFGARNIEVLTGPGTSLVLDMDGGEGGLIEAVGNVALDVFGFVQLDGSLAFKKATASFVLTNANDNTSTALTNVAYLEVGGHVNSAFAGVGAIGFELTGVDFGIVMVSDTKGTPAVTTDDINYMALKADVASAALVGIDGLTAQVTTLSVEVNKTSDLVNTNTVLDFVNTAANVTDDTAASREIATGPTTDPVTLDIDGDEGVLLAVMTDIKLDVFGFVQLDGSLAFKKATASFVLTDAATGASDTTTLASVSYLEVGGSVTSAFAGVGGIGFELTGVRFGIVMVSDTKGTAVTTDDVNYMALKADVASAGLVGIDGLTAEITTLSVVVNKTSDLVNTNKVLEFSGANSRDVATGPAPAVPVTLDIDGAEGVLLAIATNIKLDVFGFVTLEGSLSFKKATASFVLTDAATGASDTTTLASVSYLEVGGSVTSAFAGVGGIGFELTGVRFGIVMVSDTKGTAVTTDDVNYMALKADVASAGLVGIDGLTAEITTLSVVVNKTSDLVNTNKVLEFSGANSRDVATGPAPAVPVTLDIDGAEGVLLAIATNIKLDVFGFVTLEGSLSFKKATASFVLTDAATGASDTTTLASVSYLEVGGSVTSAFAGVGGIGFELTGVRFGIVMVSDTKGTAVTTDDVNYMALKADVASAGLVGIDGLTAEITTLSVVVNKTSDLVNTNKVLEFSGANSRDVATGPAPAVPVTLDIDGAEGVLLAIATNIKLDVFGFVTLEGSLSFKKATASFVLTDAATGASDTTTLASVSYLEVGGSVTSAFAGVGGIGFELTGVRFGIVMVSDTKGTAVTTDDVNYMA